jgi:hypothetical protein
MLVPDAPRTRALFEHIMRQLPGDGLILGAALETARREMLSAIRDDGTPKGVIAMRVFMMTLASGGRTVEQTMHAIMHAENGRRGYSYSVLRRCWTQFRPVAPLWLAYAVCSGGLPRRPLEAQQLREVLSVADAYRRYGEAYVTGTRETALVDPATVWTFRMPDGVELLPTEVV